MVQQENIKNEQNNYTTTTTNTTTGHYCPFLLPCGYCTKLERDCPKQYKEIRWDWTYPKVGDWNINQYEITCKT